MDSRRARVRSLGFVLLFLWVVLAPSTARANTMTIGDYRQLLQDALSSLRSNPQSAADVAQRLESIDRVSTSDQSTVQVDLSTIVAWLKASPPQVDQAETSLTTMLAQFDRADSASLSADQISAAQAQLDSILKRSEFQPQNGKSHSGIFGWIGAHVRAIVWPILGPIVHVIRRSVGGVAPWRTIGVVALVVMGILVVVTMVVGPVRAIRRLFGPRIARYAGEAAPAVLTAAELRHEAEELARDRSYRLAVRTLYLAALVRLDERGLLRFERALTNREVLRSAAIHDGATLSQRLAPLVDRVDRYWYGTELCTLQEYREFARLSEWAWEGS